MSAKEGLAIIIGKLKAQSKDNPYGQHSKLGSLLAKPDDDRAEDDMSNADARLEAAKDILAAIKADDAAALDAALSDHYILCEESEDESSDQDVDSGPSDHMGMMHEES